MSGRQNGLGAWADRLVPASFGGMPFHVRESQVREGRRTAKHAYPFREDNVVWVEDLGLGETLYSFSAFLIGFYVYDQRDAWRAVARTAGAQLLVHPSLGPITASLVNFAWSESAEEGRVVRLELGFCEQGTQLYPVGQSDTQDQSGQDAGLLDAASGDDFENDIGGPTGDPAAGTAAPPQGPVPGAAAAVQATSGQFATQVNPMVSDPSMIAGSANGLQGGYYGRYSDGSMNVSLAPDATAASALGAQVTGATAVRNSAANVTTLGQAL
ncbi:MAG TPA: DNA circularization N-terminal domain-containing protein [Acetobacteraceae bacterium]|nr:DNA circularization N-terminal domain-containing protein [Acetobacteraceae bacterium]